MHVRDIPLGNPIPAVFLRLLPCKIKAIIRNGRRVGIVGRRTNGPGTTTSAEGAKTRRRRPKRGEPGFVYNRVRMLRHEREISREEMSEALGINHRTLGYMERQQYEPKLGLAWEISEYFGLPLEAVFAREPMPPLGEMFYGGSGGS